MLLVTDFGFRCDPNVSGTLGCGYGELVKTLVIRMFREHRGPCTGNSSKSEVLAYSGLFCMLLLTDFGSRYEPNVLGTPGSGYVELFKTRSFGLFWVVLYAITH